MSNLPFEDEAVLRTDEPGTPTNWDSAEKEFDPNHPPVAQAKDTKHITKDRSPTHMSEVLDTTQPGTPTNWDDETDIKNLT